MAWQLKRCLSCFNRVAARPHRPRSRVIRVLMEAAGIPVPIESEKPRVKREESSSRSTSSDGEGSESMAEASDDSVEEPKEPSTSDPPVDAKKEVNSPSVSTASGTRPSSPSGPLESYGVIIVMGRNLYRAVLEEIGQGSSPSTVLPEPVPAEIKLKIQELEPWIGCLMKSFYPFRGEAEANAATTLAGSEAQGRVAKEASSQPGLDSGQCGL